MSIARPLLDPSRAVHTGGRRHPSFVEAVRGLFVTRKRAPPAASTVEGAPPSIEIRAPGGAAFKLTLAENAPHAPIHVGAGVTIGALIFGTPLGAAVVAGILAGALVRLAQEQESGRPANRESAPALAP